MLAEQARYDDLTSEEQAVVRAEWSERLESRRQNLDLAKSFARHGRTFVELDDDGHLVVRKPAPAKRASQSS